MVTSASQPSYFRLVPGDINGFLGLVVDNLSVLGLLAGVLIGGYGVPADIVFGKMFPGTALGVLVGDLVYTWLAVRLARRTGRGDVTAMPFGLDTPSTIGMALLVLGPAFAKFRAAGLDPTAAGLQTWYLGMAATAAMGILKLLLSFAGRTVRRRGSDGRIAGLAGRHRADVDRIFPHGRSAAISSGRSADLGSRSVRIGRPRDPLRSASRACFSRSWSAPCFTTARATSVFSACRFRRPVVPTLRLAFPHPDAGIVHGFADLGDYLALIIPFSLLTVVGGVNNTESARVAGDDYDVRSILLAEAAATLLAGLAGGVAQTTPYIGHPAFKEMGARSGYTLLTGVFVGAGGMLGFLANLIEFMPLAALAPVLVFLALNITAQAFSAVPARHAIAVAISFFPSIARLLTIELSDPKFVSPQRFAALMAAPGTWLAYLERHRRIGQRLHHYRDHLGSIRGRNGRAQAAIRGPLFGVGRPAVLFRDHSLGALGRQRLCAAAVGRRCAQCRDPILRGLLCIGHCLGAAVSAARSQLSAEAGLARHGKRRAGKCQPFPTGRIGVLT